MANACCCFRPCGFKAKWQHQSNQAFLVHGREHADLVPQILHIKTERRVIMLATKIVSEILLTKEDEATQTFSVTFNTLFQLDKVLLGSGELRFFGLDLIQNESRSVKIHADNELQSLKSFTTSRTRPLQIYDSMNKTEKKSRLVYYRFHWLVGNYHVSALFLLFIFSVAKSEQK